MSEIITSTVEKDDGHGFLKTDAIRLTEIGGVFCSEYPTSELRRGRVIENGQISPTLTTESIPDRIELGNPDFYNFLYEIDGEINSDPQAYTFGVLATYGLYG